MRTELSAKKVGRTEAQKDIKSSKSMKYEGDWNVIVECLIQALKDENKYVRWGAAGALGEMRDVRAVKPLIEALNDENYNVQRKVAWALGKLGYSAAESLIKILKNYEKSIDAGEEAE